MIVPDIVTGPTNAPLLDPDIDNDVNVWAFFTKKSVDKLAAPTVASVGFPMSKVLPRTTPKKYQS